MGPNLSFERLKTMTFVQSSELSLTLDCGRLAVTLERIRQGIQLTRIEDEGFNWLAAPQPLFAITLKNPTSNETVQLTSLDDASQVVLQKISNEAILEWSHEKPSKFAGIAVRARACARADVDALHWTVETANDSEQWSIWNVQFPLLCFREPDENASLFFPRGPGEVQQGLWRRAFEYKHFYPDGWCSMQFLAVYGSPPDESHSGRGLYIGLHDPHGSTKEFTAVSNPERQCLEITCAHPAPNMSRPGNAFSAGGDIVWQLFHGDWYDASMLYRQWAEQKALWWPGNQPKAVKKTPKWMQESRVWIRLRGDAKTCVPVVKEFARRLGLPVGFHWYNWHQIPYDNNYPHFFPAKEGFLEGIRELQSEGIAVMPYINGRLWDTLDKGSEDYLFSREALPAVTKDEKGEPYIEIYNSKKADGSPVRFAIMCPATRVWQEKIYSLVHRLFDEYGVNGVYIDQVAAAPPRLCFDSGHGHPLGGGCWWTEAYWKLLETLQRAKPENTILTTECNADPFVAHFDGYLTWHWQYEGQVPAFPAVYGGTIQMFGRSFRGDTIKTAALRMKAAQQLVFGEQIGWVESPDILNELQSMAFLRRMGLLRRRFQRYFAAGRMGRPPILEGFLPQVQADWQWNDEPWPVRLDGVLAGAWQLPEEKRVAVFLVNISDERVAPELVFDGRQYGLTSAALRVGVIDAEGTESRETQCPPVFRQQVNLQAGQAVVLEIHEAKA